MKKDLHSKDYRLVIFEDLNDGTRILTRSTVRTEETAKWEDGNEYPIVKVHISSSSHPFYTGTEKVLDLEGRVDRFKNRQEAADKAREARLKSASKTRAKKSEDDK
jgi:large subunit ribosomal protein L31